MRQAAPHTTRTTRATASYRFFDDDDFFEDDDRFFELDPFFDDEAFFDDPFFELEAFFVDDEERFFVDDEPPFFEEAFFDEDFFDEDFFEDDDFVRPSAARSLFTVAAAIALARLLLRPFFEALSLMCSYCRSSLFDQLLGIRSSPFQRTQLQVWCAA